MKKPTTKRIIPIFILVAFLMQAVIPSMVFADNQSLNYDNPNKNGDNPYKLSLKGVISSGLLTNLVGCTGIVDKVSKVTVGFAQKLLSNKTEKTQVKSTAQSEESNSVPSVDAVGIEEELEHSQEEEARDDSEAFTENCLKGIAITLAKNQLTAMTKYTMNWITTGFNGDPLYVRDVNSYMDSLTTEILEKEIEIFGDIDNEEYYPYGRDYARGQIDAYKGSQDTYKSLQQDLTGYLEDGATAEEFANDFSVGGGWNGWRALTEKPANNPLGFNLKAKEALENKKALTVETAKAEIQRGNGILDQKKCVEYAEANEPHGWDDDEDTSSHETDATPDCIKYETVTPGNVIKGKIDTYINSPERQIELADTLNDALNSLFSALIYKFESQGLSGLGSKVNNWTTPASSGFGSNSLVDSLGNTLSSTGVFDDFGSPNRVSESFDLTRDLGNKYAQALNSGSWDASTNTPEINPGVGIKNQYYTVSVAGSTKLFAGLPNGQTGTYTWKVGDKAYYDGTKWKLGLPKNIIETKGVFQLQKDYMKSITKTVAVLPQVIPKLAELDYCIPGPNTNWVSNSDEARNEYFAYLSGIYANPVTYRIDARDYGCFAVICGVINHDHHVLVTPEFSNYKKIFDDARNLWPKIEAHESFYVIRPYRTSWTFGTNTWAVRIEEVEAAVASVTAAATKAYDEYVIKTKDTYGINSPMRTEFLDNGDFNPSFLPMAQAGLDMTKNIATDAEDLPKAIETAEANFAQTSGAIYRLGFIKDKVNVIITAAQKRRKDRRVAEGLPAMPQICLDNEKVTWVENDVLKF